MPWWASPAKPGLCWGKPRVPRVPRSVHWLVDSVYAYGMSRAYPTITLLGQRMFELGYTKTDFCRATGIHERTMTEYLAARREPLPDHLWRMAEALDCSVGDLVTVD